MVDLACEVFPQLRHHIDYVEFSTPMTNNYYFGQQYVSKVVTVHQQHCTAVEK